MDSIQGLLTYNEISKTLYKIKNNKSPGSDGFSSDFLKCFWGKLGYFVLRSINYGYRYWRIINYSKSGHNCMLTQRGQSTSVFKTLETHFPT